MYSANLRGILGRAYTPQFRGVSGHATHPNPRNAPDSTSSFRRGNCSYILQCSRSQTPKLGGICYGESVPPGFFSSHLELTLLAAGIQVGLYRCDEAASNNR
jgi:hypothetical protein